MAQLEREALADGAAAYVLERGFAGLSLRPLAKALGTSDRMLLYHFGSKEVLVRVVIERLSAQLAGQVAGALVVGASAPELARALWQVLTSDSAAPHMRAYVELFALSLHEPELYGETVRGLTAGWVAVVAAALGAGPAARTDAALILAVLDGMFILRQATGDAATANEAVERFAARWAEAAG